MYVRSCTFWLLLVATKMFALSFIWKYGYVMRLTVPRWLACVGFITVIVLGLVGCSATATPPAPTATLLAPRVAGVAPTMLLTATPLLPTATTLPTALPVATATATLAPTPTPTVTATLTPTVVAVMEPVAVPATWTRHLHHVFAVQFDAPNAWELAGFTAYRAPDSGEEADLSFAAYAYPDLTTAEAVCATLPGTEEEFAGVGRVVTLGAQSFCTLAPTADALPTTAFLFYPEPLLIQGHIYPNGTYNLLAVTVQDPTLFTPIVEGITLGGTPRADLFVRGAIDILQSSYYFRDQINWTVVEQDALGALTPDSTLAEAYQQMDYLIRRITSIVGDHHIFVRRPRLVSNLKEGSGNDVGIIWNDIYQVVTVYPGSPAGDAGFQVGDVLLSFNGGDPANDNWRDAATVAVVYQRDGATYNTTLAPRPVSYYLPSRGRALTGNISYVEIFGINTNRDQFEQYVQETQSLIASLDTAPACGWVVDLRRNNGGTIAPIMAAIGTFVGDGELYRVRRVDGSEGIVLLEGGAVGRTPANSTPYTDTPYRIANPTARIAVLIGPGTVSAGELSAMVLRGRGGANVRLFGGQSYGVTTTQAFVDLFDRGQMWVPVGQMVGPDGQAAPYGVVPDEPLTVRYTSAYGTDNDPLIQAAWQWLANGGC